MTFIVVDFSLSNELRGNRCNVIPSSFCCNISLFHVVVNKLTFIQTHTEKKQPHEKCRKIIVSVVDFSRGSCMRVAQLLIYADRLLILMYGNAVHIQITAI